MKYIKFITENGLVKSIGNNPFSNLSVLETQAIVETIPDEYDYLTVTNVQEHVHVVESAYTEPHTYWDDEAQEEKIEIIEYPEVTEKYYTCDVIAQFHPLTPEQEKAKLDKKYDDLCQIYIRQLYSAGDETKILREIRAYPDNEKVIARFNKYNTDIENCLNRAHIEIYGTERT